MNKILIMLAVAISGLTAASAETAVKELSGMAATVPADAPVLPSPPQKPGTGPGGHAINIFPSMSDIYRWYQDGSMGQYSEGATVPPSPTPGNTATQAPRKYKIKVAASGGQVNVEIARSTSTLDEGPLISFNGGRTDNMFSGTILLGDSVQMAGYVNIQSGIRIKHSQHFTVIKIPLSRGAKFMVVTGNGITFMNSENELALSNTLEAGFRVDIPIGMKTSLLRFGITGGPGIDYRTNSLDGGRETTFSGTVTGNLSIINW